MTFQLCIVLASASGVLATLSLFLLWRSGIRIDKRFASVHEAADQRQKDALNRENAIVCRQEALELSFQNTRETLDPARMNRTTRAQTLQLLRVGRTADAAAAELGIARREARLLAKVADVLNSAN